MSGTPTQLVTLGALFESNNSISDYEKNDSGDTITGNTIVYPLTPEQIEYAKEYGAKYPDKIRSSLFDRIKARFSEKYLNETVALLGYSVGKKFSDIIKDVNNNKLTVKQILNHIFKADVYKSDALFSMERFRHRPIFCGVNVMYDPTVSDNFNSTTHKADYFKSDWQSDYNNATNYRIDPETKYEYRDITFSPTFLGELQKRAGTPKEKDKDELIALFTRNWFSVGLSSIDTEQLGPSSDYPAQYSRVFINDNQDADSVYDYGTTLLRSSRCLDQNEEDDECNTPNKVVILEKPELKGKKGEVLESSATVSQSVDHPCIIFTGVTFTNPTDKEGAHKGYELVSYTAVPICSWEYFKKSEYANTKAVARLEATNHCGPFTRVIAKGFYTNAVSNALQSYTEIDFEWRETKKAEDGGNIHLFAYKNSKGEYVYDINEPSWSLLLAASKEYENLNKKTIAENIDSVDDIALYEHAYYRGMERCPVHIQTLFNITALPLRFAFFLTKDFKGIHIRQYPGTPIIGALPMQDDYITQLVPMYRRLDETPSEETGMRWYINPNDILINNRAGKFYNVSQQPYEKKTYPTTKSQGVMFTYTGHLYKGPEKESEKESEKNTDWPIHIEAIQMGKIDTSLQYKTNPIIIAPNNYLQYMGEIEEPNEPGESRKAYKEFIKQGCVWQDSDGNEPDKEAAIPDSDPIGIDLSVYADVENSTKMQHSKDSGEPKEEVNKKSLMAPIIVLVVLVALIVIFIIYRVIKKRKQATAMGTSQGNSRGD